MQRHLTVLPEASMRNLASFTARKHLSSAVEFQRPRGSRLEPVNSEWAGFPQPLTNAVYVTPWWLISSHPILEVLALEI